MILLDEHASSPGIYGVVRSTVGRFYGAQVYKSPDNAQWSPLFVISRRAITGVVSGDPLPWIRCCWLPDQATSVQVVLDHDDDELVTATDEAFRAGANVARVGNELISFRTATLEEDGSWTLSYLVRGLKGTDWAVGSHGASEIFTLYSSVAASPAPGIFWVPAGMHELGTTRYYQAVTMGQALGSGEPIEHTGETLRPWSPILIRGVREADGDIVLSWYGRSRLSESPLTGSCPQPDALNFEVDVLDELGATVRTIEVSNAETTVYSAAAQAVDFPSGTPDPLEVIVYHMSEYIGRGVGKRASV